MSAMWTTCFVMATRPRGTSGGGRTSWSRVRDLGIRGRGIVQRNRAKGICLAQIQRAELGLADAHRIRQHGLEDRLQLARRTER